MRRIHFEMDCVTVYHRIVSTMFEDGIVDADRLYVLYVFTQTYCAEYKDRDCDIWTAYNRVVPATLREWNSLNLSMCNLDILSKFKKAIRSSTSLPIPRHYYYGPRKLNIILTQLRCNASFLNYD